MDKLRNVSQLQSNRILEEGCVVLISYKSIAAMVKNQ